MLTFKQSLAFDRRKELLDRQKLLNIKLKVAFEEFLKTPDCKNFLKLLRLMCDRLEVERFFPYEQLSKNERNNGSEM